MFHDEWASITQRTCNWLQMNPSTPLRTVLYTCQWAISMNHYSQNMCDIFLSPLEILPVMITTWYYTFPLGSIIQDIKCQFPCYIKFQHVTSSIRISPSCLNISVLISWINLKDQWTWSGPKICWLYRCRKITGCFMSGFEQPATWFGHRNLCWNIW